MNDKTESVGLTPGFHPRIECTQPAPQPSTRHRLTSWLKWMMVCNPFFLTSAALLLYGMYRVSIDPTFLATEVAQLTFNFASLQLYELLLTGTVLLLAARRIWHDATLLVVLENLLVLMPFILVSHAALIESQTVWTLCLLAAALAAGRTVWLGRCAGELMPPFRALLCGASVLAFNMAMPILFRSFHESKFGTKLAQGAAFEFNEAGWFWFLPALAALAHLLPRPADNRSGVVVRWFALALFLLWIGGTAVHLFCLGYVYDFDLRPDQLAPVFWVLAWTLNLRLTDIVTAPAAPLRTAVLICPMLATFSAMGATGSRPMLILSALNVVGYALAAWSRQSRRLALHLSLVSCAAGFAALPADVLTRVVGQFDRANLIGAAALVYVMLCSALSRNPKAAIGGAVVAALGAGLLRDRHDDMLQWSAQAGIVFFLLHSLRWHDGEHPGAGGVRTLIALVWAAQSLFWVCDGAMSWQPMTMSGVVFLSWCLRGLVFRNWSAMVLPLTAGLVALWSPGRWAYAQSQAAPVGVIAIVGSFVLFGAGATVALTKHRWHRNVSRSA